MKVTIW